MNVVREDPPPYAPAGKKKSQYYIDIAEKLKADPGNWYKVAENLQYRELANRIKGATVAAFRPRGSFEATARANNGIFTIYARYIGENSND